MSYALYTMSYFHRSYCATLPRMPFRKRSLKSQPYTFDRVFRLFLALVYFAVVLWLARYLSDVLIPFFVAFLLAYLLDPIVDWVQRYIKNRNLAVGATLGGLLFVVIALFSVVTPIVVSQMSETGQMISAVLEDKEVPATVQGLLSEDLWEDVQVFLEEKNVAETLQKQDVFAMAKPVVSKVLPGVWGIFTGTATALLSILGLFVIGLYLIFMLMDFDRIKRECTDLIPPKLVGGTLEFITDFNEAMGQYFRGQAVIALCTGILFAIGFTIIGLPMGIALGLFIGVLNMVPYLPLIGIVPAALLAVIGALDGGTSIGMSLLWVAIVFGVVQVIQDGLLTPRIMGKVSGLSPAFILLSISVWGKLLGFLGLILAIPLTCLGIAWYRKVMR